MRDNEPSRTLASSSEANEPMAVGVGMFDDRDVPSKTLNQFLDAIQLR